MIFPGQEDWGEPISIGIALFRTKALPATLLAQRLQKFSVKSWTVRSPPISESEPIENSDYP